MDKLWSETNDVDESDPAQFNLMEDIQCLKEEAERLKGALSEVKADLLRRGKKDNQGIIVVDLSSSVWRQLCDVLARKLGEE